MNFLGKYKIWLLILFIVGLVFASAVYLTVYEKSQLEKCKQETVGTIIEIEEQKNDRWFMKYKYTVGRTEHIATETLENRGALNFFSLGQNIDIFYSCSNPMVSRSKKIGE